MDPLNVLSQLQWHIILRYPFSSSQINQNFAAQFCITSRSHFTPQTMKIFAPRAVCRRGQHWVTRRHAICGMCRATRARRAPPPAASPCECCKRATCHGHALDKRGSPGTTASPRRVCACMLASRDLSSAQQTCLVCAAVAVAL